uniref:hypothetical protein n=1 Tax=Metapseudomonas otitidis TaxID=319939 RepID=UPI0013DFC512
SNQLFGGEGNDTLSNNADYSNNSLYVGGKGNDTLLGTFNNDTYLFELGDGQDTIIELSGNDTLRFGQGISTKDIEVRKVGLDI